jgi:hypothetical protein
MNFTPVSINDLLRCPGDRNAGTPGRHHHHVAISTALEITNVAIVRQNLRPNLQIGSRFEDRYLRRAYQDRVRFVHPSARQAVRILTRTNDRRFAIFLELKSEMAPMGGGTNIAVNEDHRFGRLHWPGVGLFPTLS